MSGSFGHPLDGFAWPLHLDGMKMFCCTPELLDKKRFKILIRPVYYLHVYVLVDTLEHHHGTNG